MKKNLDDTLFLIASGPSLNKIDLNIFAHSKYKNLNTMALNRSYVAYKDWGFYPKHYLIVDYRLINTCINDIYNRLIDNPECTIEHYIIMDVSHTQLYGATRLYKNIKQGHEIHDTTKAIPGTDEKVYWGLCDCVHCENPHQIRKMVNGEYKMIYKTKEDCKLHGHDEITWVGASAEHSDIIKEVPIYMTYYNGSSGPYGIAAAKWLGYKRVVLLGVDANYTGRQQSVESGYDTEHFHPEYFDPKLFP